MVGASGQTEFWEGEEPDFEGPAVNTDFYFVQDDEPIEVSSRKVTWSCTLFNRITIILCGGRL